MPKAWSLGVCMQHVYVCVEGGGDQKTCQRPGVWECACKELRDNRQLSHTKALLKDN